MTSKFTLSIMALVGLFFSAVYYWAPEFVTLKQFPDVEDRGLKYSITLSMFWVFYNFDNGLKLQLNNMIIAIPPI